ncbi:hypothetical protein OROGR_025227 [Orobanche gracilis]
MFISTNQGTVEDNFGCASVTFVAPDNACVTSHSFDELRTLCSSDEFLLSVYHFAKIPNSDFELIVTEQAVSFDHHCEQVRDSFLQKTDGAKSEWWPFIAHKFTSFFRFPNLEVPL